MYTPCFFNIDKYINIYIYILAQLRTQNLPNSAPLLFCQGRSGVDQELGHVAQGRFLDGNKTVKNLVRNGYIIHGDF